MRFSSLLAVVPAILLATPSRASLLVNGSVESAGPNGSSTTFTGLSAGPCAASGWSTFHNTQSTTRTDLRTTTLPTAPVGSNMMYVSTGGLNNGIEQVFLPFNTGPASATFSVWVYVVRGQVGAGVGNGGNTSLTSFSTTTGQWELLTGQNALSQSPANLFIVYASTAGGADFYVDEAIVVPAPSAACALCATSLLAHRRRRRA